MSDERSPCQCIICHDYGDRDRLGNLELRTIVHVKEYGWSVVLAPGTGGRPNSAFTVGLWHSHNSPELAMFGGDVYEMEVCLNILGGQVADGQRVAEGQRRDGVLQGHPVALRSVHARWYEPFFGQALRFYRRPPLHFLQVFWPDSEGRFPWESGAARSFTEAQPALWLPPEGQPARV